MTTYNWLTDFNNECEKLKSEIFDQGMQQMVQSRETTGFVDIIQVPINSLTEQMNGLQKHLNVLDTKFDQLSTTVLGISGLSGARPKSNPVDPVTLEKLKALAKASEVNTRGSVTTNIPAVGEKLRPTLYLKDKM